MEFREHIFALSQSGCNAQSLVREFGLCIATIYLLIEKAKADDADEYESGITSDRRGDLR